MLIIQMLQQIDDGVPFDQDDLDVAQNTIKSNYESDAFDIRLDEYWSCRVYVMNDTEDSKKMSECFISEVYLPLRDDQKQDIVTFDFPLTITMEELVKACGEPQDPGEISHYDGDDGYFSDDVEYAQSAEKYYGYRKYSFEFIKGTLGYFTMTYKP